MYKIDEKSFTIVCETKEEAFIILLQLTGYTKESFSSYMAVQVEDLEEVPQWALNYLVDLINAELIHLGYIMKDNKVAGIMGEYNEIEKSIENLLNEGNTEGSQPLKINKSIITEDGSIKIKFLVNAENILKDFLLSKTIN